MTNISNAKSLTKAQKIDMKWKGDMLIIEEENDWIYLPTIEGIRSTYFIADAQSWPNLVTRRIHLSSNNFDLTYPKALVVAFYMWV